MESEKKSKKDPTDETEEILRNQNVIIRRLSAIQKNLKRQQILAYVRFLIIIIPILIGLLLLVPTFQNLLGSYKDFFDTLQQNNVIQNIPDIPGVE